MKRHKWVEDKRTKKDKEQCPGYRGTCSVCGLKITKAYVGTYYTLPNSKDYETTRIRPDCIDKDS